MEITDKIGISAEKNHNPRNESIESMIGLIRRMLMGVLELQAGEDVVRLVNELQDMVTEAAGSSMEGKYEPAMAKIRELNLDEIFWICRTYTVFFHLVNEVERRQIQRINEAAEEIQTYEKPRSESIAEAVFRLKQKGISPVELKALIEGLDIQPTLTAHPTEARRRSILLKQNRIAELMSNQGTGNAASPGATQRTLDRISHEIFLLMVTDDVRSNRLSVEEEVKNGLFYQSHAIWEVVPVIFRDLRESVSAYFNDQIHERPFLRFRSWIGGDRDGNPNVTTRVTLDAIHEYRKTVLHNYLAELEGLWQDLSISTLRVNVPGELLDNLEREARQISLDDDILYRYRHEPFRLKIQYMMEHIGHIIKNPDDHSYTADRFRTDLLFIRECLVNSGLSSLADYPRLTDLIIRSKVFGFHFSAIDIRQHSRVHEAVLDELLMGANVISNYSGLPETEKQRILTEQLLNPRNMAIDSSGLSEQSVELLSLFDLIRSMSRTDPQAIGSYIISMTHNISDMLEVLLLAKESGLWQLKKGSVDTTLDVVPLLETISDLSGSEELMDELLKTPVYRQHLTARGNFQEIMLGYSDSSKDGGYWMSNWALHKAQETLGRTLENHGISCRFFHGRGGSVGRGGGRANQAIFAMPVESRNGRIRFTEQGEIISFRYARSPIARRHLEQIVNAMLQTAHDLNCDMGCSPEMKNLMERIAAESMAEYHHLINDEMMWQWYREVTPIEHIGKLPIASRPVSRSSEKAAEFDDLRAIPWVFSWTQTRYNVPGWYGTGTAIRKIVEQDSDNLKRLQEMWNNWPFFQTVIENLQLELARARMDIARVYDSLSGLSFHRMIAEEYIRSRDAVFSITGFRDLLDNHTAVQHTIRLRNPYTDTLSLIQAELLKRWREAPEKDAGAIRHAIFLSINGIASAMQSTG